MLLMQSITLSISEYKRAKILAFTSPVLMSEIFQLLSALLSLSFLTIISSFYSCFNLLIISSFFMIISNANLTTK